MTEVEFLRAQLAEKDRQIRALIRAGRAAPAGKPKAGNASYETYEKRPRVEPDGTIATMLQDATPKVRVVLQALVDGKGRAAKADLVRALRRAHKAETGADGTDARSAIALAKTTQWVTKHATRHGFVHKVDEQGCHRLHRSKGSAE